MRCLLTVVAFFVLVAPVAAERPATAEERAGIAAARNLPPACIDAKVSTVDARWGTFTFADAAPGQCAVGDGFAVMRRSGATWETVGEGSDTLGACQALGIPVAVGADLTYGGRPVCRPRRTYIWCLPRGGEDRERRSRPRRCTTLGPNDSFGGSANLAKLRWRKWGRRVARASGIERGFHLPLVRIHVRVAAYRRRQGCEGDFVYTRLAVTSRYGTTLVRYPRGCDDG